MLPCAKNVQFIHVSAAALCVGVGRAISRFIAPCFPPVCPGHCRERPGNNKPSETCAESERDKRSSLFTGSRTLWEPGARAAGRRNGVKTLHERIMQTSFFFPNAFLACCCYCCSSLVRLVTEGSHSFPRAHHLERGPITTMISLFFFLALRVREAGWLRRKTLTIGKWGQFDPSPRATIYLSPRRLLAARANTSLAGPMECANRAAAARKRSLR